MKIGKVSILVCIALFLFSCKKDDNNDVERTPETETNGGQTNSGGQTNNGGAVDGDFVGSWNMCQLAYEGVNTVVESGMEFKVEYTGVGKNFDCEFLVENSPEQTCASSGGYDVTVESMIEGFQDEPTVETQTVPEFLREATWSKSGTTLIITDNETKVAQEFTIEKLTDDSLCFSYDIDSMAVVSGIDTHVQVEGYYKFSRN